MSEAKEEMTTTPHPIDFDELLKRSEKLDCYDDDIVSI